MAHDAITSMLKYSKIAFRWWPYHISPKKASGNDAIIPMWKYSKNAFWWCPYHILPKMASGDDAIIPMRKYSKNAFRWYPYHILPKRQCLNLWSCSHVITCTNTFTTFQKWYWAMRENWVGVFCKIFGDRINSGVKVTWNHYWEALIVGTTGDIMCEHCYSMPHAICHIQCIILNLLKKCFQMIPISCVKWSCHTLSHTLSHPFIVLMISSWWE